MSATIPIVGAVRGRGAKSAYTGRFEAATREDVDDGCDATDVGPARLHTTLTAEAARTIISRNDSPDIGFDRSINPYVGCTQGLFCSVMHA